MASESWLPYLSERDRQHLAAGYRKTENFGFGKNPVCLVIDDYYSVLGLERQPFFDSIKKWPMSTGRAPCLAAASACATVAPTSP